MSTTRERPALWVVGAGGLLGRSVLAEAALAGALVHTSSVPWRDLAAASATLAREARTVLSTHGDVSLLWCAGAAVVATHPDSLDQEQRLFTDFLHALAEIHQEFPAVPLRLFLASSAGGVYAGSNGAPFTETTQPRAISPYGDQKLTAEAAVRDFAARTGVSVLIGRISNLYGPGQNLTKPQGLITQLCLAQLQHSPLLIFVSLDTARDYLYVRDAARMILAGMDRLAERPIGTVVVKIFASRVSTTLAAIIGEIRRISRRRSPIVMGVSPASRFHVRDLRFRSVIWKELDSFASTPLPAGIACTLDSVAASIFAARVGQ